MGGAEEAQGPGPRKAGREAKEKVARGLFAKVARKPEAIELSSGSSEEGSEVLVLAEEDAEGKTAVGKQVQGNEKKRNVGGEKKVIKGQRKQEREGEDGKEEKVEKRGRQRRRQLQEEEEKEEEEKVEESSRKKSRRVQKEAKEEEEMVGEVVRVKRKQVQEEAEEKVETEKKEKKKPVLEDGKEEERVEKEKRVKGKRRQEADEAGEQPPSQQQAQQPAAPSSSKLAPASGGSKRVAREALVSRGAGARAHPAAADPEFPQQPLGEAAAALLQLRAPLLPPMPLLRRTAASPTEKPAARGAEVQAGSKHAAPPVNGKAEAGTRVKAEEGSWGQVEGGGSLGAAEAGWEGQADESVEGAAEGGHKGAAESGFEAKAEGGLSKGPATHEGRPVLPEVTAALAVDDLEQRVSEMEGGGREGRG